LSLINSATADSRVNFQSELMYGNKLLLGRFWRLTRLFANPLPKGKGFFY